MKIKKIFVMILSAVCLSCFFGAAVFAFADAGEEEDGRIIKYIKNSYTSGAYMFEENGVLRYGIPLDASEEQFMWEFIGHDGDYEIKNVATGHSITVRDGSGSKTSVKQLTDYTPDDLWRVDVTVPSDESRNFISANGEDMALHIIEITDGYVASEPLGANYTYGEAKWALFDESEINFSGAIRDGFCIGYGGNYLTADGLVFKKPVGPDDNYIWQFEVVSDGKLIYNLGKKQYLSISEEQLVFTDRDSATHYAMFATAETAITSEGFALTAQLQQLTAGTNPAAANAKLNLVLASSVGTVLGDLKLNGTYTLSNSWFSMYMLDDGGIPTYGNSNPNNPQIQWEVTYDEATGYTALKNLGANEYLCFDGTSLSFSAAVEYCWKLLRSSNDLYPEAVRFAYAQNTNTFLHMENTNGQLECTSAIQGSWGSPHWEASVYDSSSAESMASATVETGKWVRIKSVYSDGLYFYQTNGGYAYGSISEKDARGHWQFVREGDGYLLYNRNFGLYVSSFGNGYLAKTEDKDSATRFGVRKYLSDGAYLIYETNEKDYLANYVNIKNRDSIIHLTLVSVDIKETRWILEEAPEEIETNEIVVSNTVLSTFKESGVYAYGGTDGLIVEHYGSYVRVSRPDGKYLYINGKGKAAWKKFTHDYDSDFYFNYTVYGDNMQLTHGGVTLTLNQIATDRRFDLAEGFVVGNQSTVSVYAAQAGEYTVKLHTANAGISTTVSVDGIAVTTFRSGELSETKIKLNKGNNLVRVNRADAVDSITVCGIISNGYQGTTQGLTAYELENGKTNANVEIDSRERYGMPNEASGRSYVLFENVTEYVEVTLVNQANAFSLRYSVPDTADGKGRSYTLSMYVNGKDRGNVILSSEYSHLYKEWYYSNTPADGFHHVYFDELTYVFGETLPAGTVLRFRKDFDDEAAYYALDMLETEVIPDKVEKPDNALSITDYGAVPDDDNDDYQALVDCIAAAVKQRKEVYIPEGVYYMRTLNASAGMIDSDGSNHSSKEYANRTLKITNSGVTIRGAGYWFTEIHGLEFDVDADNFSVYSLKLSGYADTRHDTAEHGCFDVTNGDCTATNLTIANVWIEHYKCGAWINCIDNVFISGNRIRYTYADGINLHAGVVNAVVENNSIRSTGDDGLAEWSDGIENTGLTFRYNSIENPWHANCIALYGGTNLSVYNNVLKDTAYRGAGVNISTDFKPTNFKGSLIVNNNLIIRCGGDNDTSSKDVGAIWFNMVTGYDAFASMQVKNNVILDSTHQGISFEQTSIICSLILEENVISGSGSYGIDISSDFYGNIFIANNSVTGSALEDILDSHKEGNATVVICDDAVQILSDNSAATALWSVGAILAAGAAVLAVILTVSLVKKGGRKD